MGRLNDGIELLVGHNDFAKFSAMIKKYTRRKPDATRYVGEL